MKTKKSLVMGLLGVMLLVAAGAVFMWNKPHESVEGKEGIQLTAENLTLAFAANEQQANAQYLNQVIEVQGTIVEATKNQDGKDVLLLESSDPLSGVQCTMKEPGNFSTGTVVTLKGFCNGYTMVVLLGDCVVVNK